SFKASRREILGMDGAFIKGPYTGQILTAVGVDNNNGAYTLAYAIVEVESKSSWRWELTGMPCKHDVATIVNMKAYGKEVRIPEGRPMKKAIMNKDDVIEHALKNMVKSGRMSKMGTIMTCGKSRKERVLDEVLPTTSQPMGSQTTEASGSISHPVRSPPTMNGDGTRKKKASKIWKKDK
ncbi:transposase, mutator type, MULE transposase domain protein, partial [Tanacetum coccineum]